LGAQAFLVGGCVRDLMLGRSVHDWDICTSMLPEDILSAFDKTIPTGLKHGTVTVLHEGIPFEITTFRTESIYSDHRKPDLVTFTPNLEEDLSRRDFTVNAMAMDRFGRIIDLFGGFEDLKAQLLRCVGEPLERYREDALRILRCVRFSAQLGFSIDAKTAAAMREAAPLCIHLSAERIREETEKILCSDSPAHLSMLTELGILDRFGLREVSGVERLRTVSPDRLTRWCMLYFMYPTLDLTSFRLEKKLTELAISAFKCRGMLRESVSVKRAVYLYGREAVRMSAVLDQNVSALDTLDSDECMEMRQLAVSGKDFPQIRGTRLGALLRRLLSFVWEHPDHNTKDQLFHQAEIILSDRNNPLE